VDGQILPADHFADTHQACKQLTPARDFGCGRVELVMHPVERLNGRHRTPCCRLENPVGGAMDTEHVGFPVPDPSFAVFPADAGNFDALLPEDLPQAP
jgi:hypothetical protein